MNQNDLTLSATSIVREMKVGNVSKSEEKDVASFFQTLSKGAHFDTGILPLDGTGTLAIRKALNHTQVVFQYKPEKYLIIWGGHENDTNAGTYSVAQPYRIVIGDLIDDNLLGCRSFYSPVPVQTGDQIMYHMNVPNLNCKGYNGTSVGWMCLYHKHDWSKLAFDQRFKKLLERAAGGEAYNDANMSSTDGARFYKKANKPKFTWDPATWAKKTEEEGVEWTLEPGLWIPVKVEGADSQLKHDDNGVPLTLEMAMLGGYNAYYTDKTQPKPVNAWARNDLPNPDGKKIYDFIIASFTKSGAIPKEAIKGVKVGSGKLLTSEAAKASPAKATVKKTPKKEDPAEPVWDSEQVSFAMSVPANPVIGHCADCKGAIHHEDTWHHHPTSNGAKCCANCIANNYGQCAECFAVTHFGQLQTFENKTYCKKCHNVYACPKCGKQYLNDQSALIGQVGCIGCTEVDYCAQCNGKFVKEEILQVPARDPVNGGQSNYPLCMDCMMRSVKCGCGFLREQSSCGLMGDSTYACQPCIKYEVDTGVPYYVCAMPEDQETAVDIETAETEVVEEEAVKPVNA